MADITEIAVASWRLEKWLDNVNVERKMAAKSALRSIKKYLKDNNIEVVDLTGTKFDVGLAVSVVNNESDETDEDKLIVSEMVKPIVKENGAVIQYGQVILGDEVKKQKENNPVAEDTQNNEVDKVVAIAEAIETSDTGARREESSDEINNPEHDKFLSKKNINFKWAIIATLQVIIIASVLLMAINIGKIRHDIAEPPVVDVGDTAFSDISINDLNDRVDSIQNKGESDISGINEKVDDILEELEKMGISINDISTYLDEQRKEQEETPSNDDSGSELYFAYVVKHGDTLYNICVDNGINYDKKIKEIMKINDISDPNYIIVGQKIILPKE